MAYTYNSRYLEAEIRIVVPGQPGQIVKKTSNSTIFKDILVILTRV
jgi:hypothetical protein